MNNAGPGYASLVLTPEDVRARLPLDWTLGKLFSVWNASKKLISCPFQGHRDSSPSFNIWAPDSEGVPQRYGCMGCGKRGDVIDLIKEAHGVDFLEAMKLAIQLIGELEGSGWTRSRNSEALQIVTPDDILKAHNKMLPMSEKSIDIVAKFLEERKIFNTKIFQYYLTEWEWGGKEKHGVKDLFMPHRDRKCTLVGVKFRNLRSSKKWVEDGSDFTNLYGAWRDFGYKTVVLCEGESDTVLAAYQLQGLPVDVFGLPSGANADPTEKMLTQLGSRRVILIFDGDKSGLDAMNLWNNMLSNSLIVKLPDEKDISSCGIPVTNLIKTYKMTNPISTPIPM